MANDFVCVLGPIPKKRRSRKKTAATTITSIANLPEELMIEILTRLDIKTIVTSRCVCKFWTFLLSPSNREFTELHFARSTVHFVLQEPFSLKSKFCIVEVKDEGFDYAIHFTLPRNFPDSDYFIANSCDGLICLAASRRPYYLMKVCNPITGEYFNLPQFKMNYALDVVVSGLGISMRTKKYKVVRWVCERRAVVRKIEVYTVGTYSWRTVGIVPDYVPCYPGIYLNGAFHWACCNKRGSPDYIISFDLESESFTSVPPPFTFFFDPEGPEKFIRTGALGNFLYLRNHNELWVMREYGVQESWEKLDVVGAFLPSYQPIKFLRGGEILMNLGGIKGKLIAYDPVKKTSGEFELPKLKCQFGAINYVPSFKPMKDILAAGDKSSIPYILFHSIKVENPPQTSPATTNKEQDCVDSLDDMKLKGPVDSLDDMKLKSPEA